MKFFSYRRSLQFSRNKLPKNFKLSQRTISAIRKKSLLLVWIKTWLQRPYSFISLNNKDSLITVGIFAATSVISHVELVMEVSNL